MITYCIFSALINAIASLVLGLTVYFKASGDVRNRVFAWFATMVAIWSVFYLAWMLSSSYAEAYFYVKWLTAAAIFAPISYFHFIVVLLGLQMKRHVYFAYSSAVVFVFASLGSWLVVGVEPRGEFPFWPVPGWLYPFYLLIFFYYVVLSVFLLFRGYRTSIGRTHNQLRFVAYGTSLGFLGGSTNFFLWYNIPIPPVGNALVSLYVIGVGYAVVRFRMLEFNVLVARIIGAGLFVSLVAFVISLFAEFIRILTASSAGGGVFMSMFLSTLVMAAVAYTWLPPFKEKFEAILEARVLAGRTPVRARLRSLSERISAISDEQRLFDEIVSLISADMGSSNVALFIKEQHEGIFRVKSRSKSGFMPDSIREDEAWVRYLRGRRSCLLVEEIEASPKSERMAKSYESLRRDYEAELVVPVYSDNDLTGFIAMGRCARGLMYTESDIVLLDAAGAQLGIALRARHLERQANQSEKLIALGTLAAGLAHEIRNPLVSIRTFGSLIEEQGADPEFRREYKAVVERDVNRIATILDNVAAFADNTQVKFTPVNVGEVVRAVHEIARPDFKQAGVSFRPPGEDPPYVIGNYNQLLQVFLNLFQNAIHAMEGRPDPVLEVRFEVVKSAAGERSLLVSVSDNGAGIDSSVQTRIFEPFITTKATGDGTRKRGMGLGLSIVKRIIEAHKGAVTVSSKAGAGTTFNVYLPCAT